MGKERIRLKRVRNPHAHLVGSWASDRITIAGDYGDVLPGQEENLYYVAQREYDEDISSPMRELINCDKWLHEKFAEQFRWAESLNDNASTSLRGRPVPESGADVVNPQRGRCGCPEL